MDEDFLQSDLAINESEETKDLCVYVCSTCHTSFTSYNSTLTTCLYCGGKMISQGDNYNDSNLHYLPFAVSLEDAFDNYKNHIRHNMLAPFSFRGKRIMKKINKIYVPCSLYNLSIEGNIMFYGADKIKSVKGSPKQIFESMYSTHFDYNHLLISNYSRINDVLISNINDYDFDPLVAFDPSIAQDSCLIVSDVEKDEINEKVHERAIKQCAGIVRGAVNHEFKKLSENHLSLGVSSSQSILIPIYFINFRYKGQEYMFLMNGQTGNTIFDVPSSKGNLILFSILCFFIIFIIGCVIAHFL